MTEIEIIVRGPTKSGKTRIKEVILMALHQAGIRWKGSTQELLRRCPNPVPQSTVVTIKEETVLKSGEVVANA